jgi:transposase
MANQLKMAKIQMVWELYRLGWSQRRIARDLALDRETVRKYLVLARERSQHATMPPAVSVPEADAKPVTGPARSEDPPAGEIGSNPTRSFLEARIDEIVRAPRELCLDVEHGPPGIAAEIVPARGPVGRASECDRYRALILLKLEQGLSAQRIYQDLRVEAGFTASYDSVKRFVRRCGVRGELPVRRLECLPGAEAQVDFGTGVPITLENGRRRRTYVFRTVLSHSRKGYSEVTCRQTTEDFIGALENAFWHFGGVPQTLVIDNLRAAVKHPDWFDPELVPKVRSFAEHYGTVILPTKPYTPRHKGKVENGIDYVKENGLKGHTFQSLEEENRHLATWEETVADTRIHGTTRKQVGKAFREVERPCLQPLPPDRFPLFQEAKRTVNRDGHVEVGKAYYSVHYDYLGHDVWARWDARLVRIFDLHMRPIAVHTRIEPGRFQTRGEHLPRQKINSIEHGTDWLFGQVRLIGLKSQAWAQAMFERRGIEGIRVLQGLISLGRRHPSQAVENACGLALSYGEFRLRTLRRLLHDQGRTHPQKSLPFLDEHPIIRPLDDYGQFVHAAIWTAAAFPPGFSRHDRTNESSPQARQGPGDRDHQGPREIHPPWSGYSLPGCSPAEPDSASPNQSGLIPSSSRSQEVSPHE